MLRDSQASMWKALHLTRSGQLAKATVLLQAVLSADAAAAAAPSPASAERSLPLAAPVIEASGMQEASAWSMPTSAWSDTLKDFLGKASPALGGTDRARPLGAKPEDIVPPGGRFIHQSYRNAAGGRSYKLYLPSSYREDGKALPLVIMLHGCTQSPDDFAAGTRMNQQAEKEGFLVAYPEQPASANSSKCWNWFKPQDQQHEKGEPSLIAGITRQIMHQHRIDPKRLYVAGLSAGGAAAAIMGQRYPDLYAAVGVHSGLACGAARDLPSALTAMKQGASQPGCTASGKDGRHVPTITFHGDRDQTVHPRNGKQVIDQAKASGGQPLEVRQEHGQAPGGRHFLRTLYVNETGTAMLEEWVVKGAGHAWCGGSSAGSYTDPKGPDASREMVRFFLSHSL